MNAFERKATTFLIEAFVYIFYGLVAFYLGVWIAPGDPTRILVQLPWLYLAGGILFSVAFFNDCYSIESIEKQEKFFLRWLVAWLISCFIYFVIFLVLSRESQAFRSGFIVPRLLPGTFLFLVMPGIPISRVVFNRLFHWTLRPSPALLAGKPASCDHFIREIRQSGFKNWKFIGRLDLSTGRLTGLEGVKEAEIQLTELAWFVSRTGVSEI
ncbi:MAG: hypothetical protein EBR69_06090, partial [Synechococcaceae bacterium WB4_2_0805]|nr:hypothetical protein [Synechococcaceae bacterium WB4_2_0805]